MPDNSTTIFTEAAGYFIVGSLTGGAAVTLVLLVIISRWTCHL